MGRIGPVRVLLPLAILMLALVAGCPADGESKGGADSQPPQGLNPAQPIPEDNPYLEYAKLRLGMSAVDIAQVYNAPKGQGDGFTRVIEYHGDVHHHIIDFDAAEDREKRRIIASFYRDELYLIVDDRDWMTLEHRDAWWDELVALYGGDFEAVLRSSQWSWGDKESVLLTFTQDNASEKLMNGNVVLQHTPTWEAAHKFLEYWEAEHPELYKPDG